MEQLFQIKFDFLSFESLFLQRKRNQSLKALKGWKQMELTLGFHVPRKVLRHRRALFCENRKIKEWLPNHGEGLQSQQYSFDHRPAEIQTNTNYEAHRIFFIFASASMSFSPPLLTRHGPIANSPLLRKWTMIPYFLNLTPPVFISDLA